MAEYSQLQILNTLGSVQQKLDWGNRHRRHRALQNVPSLRPAHSMNSNLLHERAFVDPEEHSMKAAQHYR